MHWPKRALLHFVIPVTSIVIFLAALIWWLLLRVVTTNGTPCFSVQ